MLTRGSRVLVPSAGSLPVYAGSIPAPASILRGCSLAARASVSKTEDEGSSPSSYASATFRGGVAQLVERAVDNRYVVGSNPAAPTKNDAGVAKLGRRASLRN